MGAAGLANCGAQTSFAALWSLCWLEPFLESARKKFVSRRADNGAQRFYGWTSGERRESRLEGQTDIMRGQGDGSFHLFEGHLLEVGNSSPDQAFGSWEMWCGQQIEWGDTYPFGML